MLPTRLIYRLRLIRRAIPYVSLVILGTLAEGPLRAQDETFSIRVDLVWVTPPARTALTSLRSTEDKIGDADDLHAFRLNTGDEAKQAILTGRRDNAVVPILSRTLIMAPDREASFVIGGRAHAPVVAAAAQIQEPSSPGVEPLGPPLPMQPTALPKRSMHHFGLKVSLRPHKRNQGNFFIELRAEINGVDFSQARQRSERITPQLTFREFEQVLEVEPSQTFALAGMLTSEDLVTLRRAPGLDRSSALDRVIQLRQDNPQGSVLVLVTPRLVTDQSQGGAVQ